MMDNINQLPFGDNDYCLKILGAIAEAYQPINLAELRVLVNLSPVVDIETLIIKHCFTFLDLCCDSVCFTHHSAREFYIDHMTELSTQRHRWIAQNCLTFLTKFFNPPADNCSNEERGRHLTTSTYYPTVYWIQHLYHVIDDKEVTGQAVDFMTKYLLKWSDLLVSLGGLSQACYLMLDLETLLKVCFSH